jgi:iron complex outermembrane receptor protein/hemoglobin/transferrin/lactoferrin receptor protein
MRCHGFGTAAIAPVVSSLLVAVLCCPAALSAEPATELSEVTVTATRGDKAAYDAPVAVSVVTPYEIARRTPFSAIDALREETGIIPQRTTNGQGSPIVRGLTGYHTLLLIDGVRLNNATFRSGPNQYFNTIAVSDIERVEVVRGPSLYGNSSLGGVVHALSRPLRAPAEGLELRPRLFAQWGSSAGDFAGGVSVEGGRRALGLRAGVARRSAGDVHPGRGRDVHVKGRKFFLTSGEEGPSVGDTVSAGGKTYPVTAVYDKEAPTHYTETSGSAALAWQVDDGQTVRVAYQGLRQRVSSRWDKIASREEFDRIEFDPQERHLVYGTYRAHRPLRGVETFAVTLSYHRQIEGQTRLAVGGDPAKDTKRTEDAVDTLGLSVLAASPLGTSHRLTYGADVYRDAVTSRQRLPKRADWGTFPNGADALDVNLFLQDEVALAPSLTATAGANATRYALSADLSARDATFGAIENDGLAATGSGALAYELAPGIRAHASVGTGFRAPSLDDLSGVRVTNQGIQAPSPDVGPERSLHTEIGLKVRRPRYGGTIAVFRNRLDGQMVQQPVEEVYGTDLPRLFRDIRAAHPNLEVTVLDNVDRSVIRGVEVDAHVVPFEGWTAFGLGTWTRGEVLRGDGKSPDPAKPWEAHIRREPPASALLGVRWEPPASTFWAEFVVRGAAKQNRLNAADIRDPRIPGFTRKAEEVDWDEKGRARNAGTPGWVTLNLRGGVRLLDRTRLTVAVENVSDRRYREHGSGVNGPGRNLVLSVESGF